MPKNPTGPRKRARGPSGTRKRTRARRSKPTKAKGPAEMPNYLLESHPEMGLK
jgi:hypothetical protein